MEFRFVPPDLRKLDETSAELIACSMWKDERPMRGLAGLLDWRLAGKISKLARESFIEGELGEVLFVPGRPRLPFDKIIVLGLGTKAAFGDGPFREAVTRLLRTLEEAAILLVAGGVLGHDEVVALRSRIAGGEESLTAFLAARSLRLDLASLHPFARWVTPIAEARRFDTRFYVAVAPSGQRGAHDDHETTSSFWARPSEVLTRFEAGQVQLAPPTHRTLEIFAHAARATDFVALASTLSLEPICPRLVKHADARGETVALVLPGDPEHPVRDVIVPGKSRYVLRDGRFLSEDAPSR